MNKQTDKTTAIYFRSEHKLPIDLWVDVQMCKLLTYATRKELDDFTLYADIGKSELRTHRLALNTLMADIEAGRISKVIVLDVSRITSIFTLMEKFFDVAQKQNVEVISLTEGTFTSSPYADISKLFDYIEE